MKKIITILFTTVSIIGVSQNRIAILEDYRGHKCGLCPGGDVIANQIIQDYGDSVIVIAINAGSLSTPNGSGTHTTDFRTTEGNTYNSTFGILGTPTGIVNRAQYNSNLRLTTGSWDSAVKEIINDSPSLNFSILNGYNKTTKELTLNVNTVLNENLTGNYSLIINILEDSIYDWQTDYNASPSNTQDYLHNHVLRGNINGTWGTSVIVNNASSEDSILKQFIYTLNNDWDENHLSLVAYIYDESTNEIINAKKHHIDLDILPLTITDTSNIQSLFIDKEDIAFNIYPNPTSDQLIIKFEGFGTFNILDLNGKIILSNQEINKSIDINFLDKGMYLVEINTSNLKGYKKLVIK